MGLNGRQRAFGVAIAIAALATLGFALLVRLQPWGENASTAIDELGQIGAAVIAAAAAGWATTQTEGRIRLAWALLTLSAASWAAAESVVSFFQLGLGIVPSGPSWAEVGFLGAIVFAFAGIRAFWREPRDTPSSGRVWLDATIIFLALTFTAWIAGLRAVWDGPSGWARTIQLGHAFGDILVVTVTVLAIRRATRRRATRMLVLLAAVTALIVADAGAGLDTARFAAYLIVAGAAAWPRSPVSPRADNTPVDLWQLALPWLTVLGSGIALMWLVVSGGTMDRLLMALAGVGVILLTLTMILSSRDFLRMLAKSQASERNLVEVIEQAPAGVVRLDRDLRVIQANQRFRTLLDATGGDGAKPITSVFGEVDAARFKEQISSLRSGVESVEGEAWAQQGNGARVWLHWSATAVRNIDGECEYFIAMFEDTTARHAAEAAAAANLELMQRLSRVKTEFLQSVSHEFKTALIGIQGFSEFMRDTDQLDAGDARTFAADIYRDAERLDRMVTEMLDLDHAETERARVQIAPLDLNALILREVAAADRGIDLPIETRLEDNLPLVLGDTKRLGEVISILLRSAIKHSPDGGHVRISTSAQDKLVTVSVTDQGLGALPDFDQRLLQQDDLYADSPIRKVVGAGIGLGIVRQLVELHGGRLWTENPAGGGHVFHFTLRADLQRENRPDGLVA